MTQPLRMPRILYLHGYGARPGGIKPQYLRSYGCEVINPALGDDDFQDSVRVAQLACDTSHPDLVIGSSRGGAVALAIDVHDLPLILIAPAWKYWGPTRPAPCRTIVLHSAADEYIPCEDSRELVARSGLPQAALRVVGESHRMNDGIALDALWAAVQEIFEPPS